MLGLFVRSKPGKQKEEKKICFFQSGLFAHAASNLFRVDNKLFYQKTQIKIG